jgi:hypothetical protein
MRRLLALFAGFSGDARTAGACAPQFHRLTYIELDSTGVVFGGSKTCNGEILADQIERGQIDTDADRGLTGLHIHKGRHGDPHTLGPGGERLAPAQACHGEIGAELCQRIETSRQKAFGGSRSTHIVYYIILAIFMLVYFSIW